MNKQFKVGDRVQLASFGNGLSGLWIQLGDAGIVLNEVRYADRTIQYEVKFDRDYTTDGGNYFLEPKHLQHEEKSVAPQEVVNFCSISVPRSLCETKTSESVEDIRNFCSFRSGLIGRTVITAILMTGLLVVSAVLTYSAMTTFFKASNELVEIIKKG
jgi:hypothetical protein